MNKIFLSYALEDESIVKKLKRDLEKNRYDVWIDQEKIGIGDEIISKIQEGLEDANFLIIWLTKFSVESGWVKKEWQSKLHKEISQKKTLVLPILAENCEIPSFLLTKRYADFRSGYKQGLEILLKDLKSKSEPEIANTTVFENTINLLNDLDYAKIFLPNLPPLHLVKYLKIIPRTGKLIRLNNFNKKIRIRTIYDHVISLAKMADLFLPEIKNGINDSELVDLAKCIVYHDLCEVLLGDIPAYTNIPKGESQRLSAERLLMRWDSKKLKSIANEFITLFLEKKESDNLKHSYDIISNKSEKSKLFNLLDKIDPIISVWSYIYHNRKKQGFDIYKFTLCLKDFFENQKVREVAERYTKDKRVYSLIKKLQDRSLANKYFTDSKILDSIFSTSGLPLKLKQIIESDKLFYSDKIYVKKNASHPERKIIKAK